MNSDLDRDRSAPQPQPAEEAKPLDPRTKDIKKRVESWLKDSEEDANKADEYLDKKKEIRLKMEKALGLCMRTDLLMPRRLCPRQM